MNENIMRKRWTKLVEQTVNSNFNFFSGLNVWIERPHILNRKLLATEIIDSVILSYFQTVESQNTILHESTIEYLARNSFTSVSFEEYFRTEILQNNNSVVEINDTCGSPTLKLRKLIPRNSSKFSDVLEIVFIDNFQNCVTFWPKESDVQHSAITPTFPYRMKLEHDRFIIETYHNNNLNFAEGASEQWLKSVVLPKILKWCCTSLTSPILPSLRLVSIKDYSLCYSYLKKKYGKKYVEKWTECSDPLKYVYEDIAIAAYLMTIWEKERNDLKLSSKQSFVDLGCGNGLLVDILACEGYFGLGIDVRKRKIWDLYDSTTKLIEKSVEPSSYHLFPEFDWIIGNHSDELTPWIPVIAARSSYDMRVFLVPCCSFTFNGKYERKDSKLSQYQSYLSFIHTLCESMGFNVQEDKLRIPSTKRVCFLCTSRSYQKNEEDKIDLKRQEFIFKHSVKSELSPIFQTSVKNPSSEQSWLPNFKPRASLEVIRNCSKLDRAFLDETVKIVANILLEAENYITVVKGSQTLLWNSGRKIMLGDLIKLMNHETLKQMKHQYGGFQTFLRNHKNVFQINNGVIQLTVPSKELNSVRKPLVKKKSYRKRVYSFQEKPCYFFFHHPQGCPLEAEDCSFSHKS